MIQGVDGRVDPCQLEVWVGQGGGVAGGVGRGAGGGRGSAAGVQVHVGQAQGKVAESAQGVQVKALVLHLLPQVTWTNTTTYSQTV